MLIGHPFPLTGTEGLRTLAPKKLSLSIMVGLYKPHQKAKGYILGYSDDSEPVGDLLSASPKRWLAKAV